MARSDSTDDLFGAAGRRRAASQAPLAERLRPLRLAEMVGHEELLGAGSLLRQEVDSGRLVSLLLWGPPGSGKTTLACILAQETKHELVRLSAVSAGVADLRRALQGAEQRLGTSGRPTLLFVDEIHRFHKGQQDALLHEVEDGRVVLVGATTENPAFHLNAALLSRCRLLRLEALDADGCGQLLERALVDRERGLGTRSLRLDDEARDELIRTAAGDARRLLNHLERAALMAAGPGAESDDGGAARGVRITADHVRSARGELLPAHDRGGDRHFDLLSALHKSLRGSDPDAATYYVQRLLVAGEPPTVIARRLVRMASEDIGLADPRALSIALDALRAAQFLGLPEGDAALCQAAIYLAIAPKSDAVYRAGNAAREAVHASGALDIPPELWNSPRPGKQPYDNPHSHGGGPTQQQHLPAGLQGRRFYEPGGAGLEARVRDRLEELRRARRSPPRADPDARSTSADSAP